LRALDAGDTVRRGDEAPREAPGERCRSDRARRGVRRRVNAVGRFRRDGRYECDGRRGAERRDESDRWHRRIYANGVSFPASDGCNTCFCSDGEVACTLIDCPLPSECDRLSSAYQDALAEAKYCEPSAEFTYCVPDVVSSLQCGCPTTVNSWADLSVFARLAQSWSEYGCGKGVVCGACPPPPSAGYCSDEKVCVDAYAE
jgi:hypothetical protein